jgi:hypothetical protein
MKRIMLLNVLLLFIAGFLNTQTKSGQPFLFDQIVSGDNREL